MAVTTIPWGDGSGDNIYLTYPSASGDQPVQVSSDANTGSSSRTQTVTFTASHHGTSDVKTLTVVQEGVPEQYIVFADPVVGQICATKWGDGTGIKPSQAAQVTNAQFGTTFRDNTQITSFDELRYFTGLTLLPANAFNGCSSLSEITLSENIGQLYMNSLNLPNGSTLNLGDGSPYCTSGNAPGTRGITKVICKDLLQYINFFSGNSNVSYSCVFGYSAGGAQLFDSDGNEITNCDIPNTVTKIYANTFAYNKSITSITIPSSVTTLGVFAFNNCPNVTGPIEIPSSVTRIENSVFENLGTTSSPVTYIMRGTTPPTITNRYVFTANRLDKIYVPYSSDHSILAAYQSASNWSTFASYMVELNPDGTIPT